MTSSRRRDVAIDGAIVYSCRPNSAARDWLVRRKIPLVYVDQEPVAGARASTSTTEAALVLQPST